MRSLQQTAQRVQAPGFPTSVSYSHAYRLLDDIDRAHAELIAKHGGGDADQILQVGYGLMTITALRALGPIPSFVKTGLIVLPCRDPQGRIVALHDDRMRWITEPSPHVVNAVRAQWSAVQTYETTSQADAAAIEMNICAVAVNGCDKQVVDAVITSLSQGRRLAA